MLKLIITLILILIIILTFYFYKIVSIKNDSPVTKVKEDSLAYPLLAKFDVLPKEVYSIENDGLNLKAWYVPAEEETDKTVVIVHGHRQDRTGMRHYGQPFHECGYNLLMPDNRGHGKSDGKDITYGYYDKRDIIAWAKYLEKINPNVSTTFFGVSMGGATVMMASGEDNLPESVKNIIQDCGFSNVFDELAFQAKAQYGISKFPMLYTVSLVNKIRQGWFYSQGDSVSQLERNTRPILMIHGDSDTYVPYFMLDINYNAVKEGTPKEKVTIKGAEHALSIDTDLELYRQFITDFMAKYN